LNLPDEIDGPGSRKFDLRFPGVISPPDRLGFLAGPGIGFANHENHRKAAG